MSAILGRAVPFLFIALVALFSRTAMAQASPPEDPGLAALLAARSAAEDEVAQGRYAEAIDGLLQSLRAADPARADLADAAYGNGQLISYVLLHVMPEPAAYAYLENGFQPTQYETDKAIKVLCTIAIGLEEADKTAQTREAIYLTSSENHIVRAIVMFYLSNPYFYDNTAFTGQYTEMLAAQYPALELTQTSLNLGLYAKRETGDLRDLAAEVVEKSGASQPLAPWSRSLRARIRESADNLEKKAGASRAEAVAPLLRGITEAKDWRERHFALLLLKHEFDGDLSVEVREAAGKLAARRENTPDTLQARALLASGLGANCAADPENEILRDEALAAGRALLERGVGELTPERVMWETWAYGIRDCARGLAAAGHGEAAAELFAALAERLPGSKIAAESARESETIFYNKPLELQGHAIEPQSSSPRRRGSSALAQLPLPGHWIPAFAGMTADTIPFVDVRLQPSSPHPRGVSVAPGWKPSLLSAHLSGVGFQPKGRGHSCLRFGLPSGVGFQPQGRGHSCLRFGLPSGVGFQPKGRGHSCLRFGLPSGVGFQPAILVSRQTEAE